MLLEHFIADVKLFGMVKKAFLIYHRVDIKFEKIKIGLLELNGSMLFQHGNLDIKKNVGKKEEEKNAPKTKIIEILNLICITYNLLLEKLTQIDLTLCIMN